jgi:hypothetical protein
MLLQLVVLTAFQRKHQRAQITRCPAAASQLMQQKMKHVLLCRQQLVLLQPQVMWPQQKVQL